MALNQPQPLAFDPSQLIGHTWRLARLDLTLLFRNRMAFFTAIAFPLLLGSVALLLRSGYVSGVSTGLYTLTGMLALAGFFVTFMHLTTVFTVRREELVLKRMRGSVLSEAAIFAGSGLATTLVYVVQAAVLITLSITTLGGHLPRNLPLLFLGVVLGSVMFVPLAAALSGVTKSGESAQITVLPAMLVLAATSQASFPLSGMPELLQRIAASLPLSPVVDVIRIGYFGLDFTEGAPHPAVGFAESWGAAAPRLLLIWAWIVVGTLIARKYFRWEPRHG
ncbi:ABC-2 type transport system permease protein [Nonomuraea thailandensis]|uniref:ABC-2 type transport system permease protein n=1 Tax=Nonomuraea thailandensis TaxID=1188745 RepID=A0A9X2KD56_9ACTN|nr:ABC transporter permease [Nonomuraea thailandensis]MCP2365741.1 ABC-2 type transport system permease protein [Nonomuraea thailandensis]